jgi:DNA modification methylase
MAHQDKLTEEKDEFVESLSLTPEKIRADLEKMRDIEGFPVGDSEDILELSDPPYYTSYPNPYIKDFIEAIGNSYKEKSDDYDIEPYVGDVSEGKNNPVYNAHSYPTKVPYKAIEKFVKHYTKPGDIIFDGFCGTGMTGLAAISSGRFAILNDLSVYATFISSNYNKKADPQDMKKIMKSILYSLEKEVIWMYKTKHTNGEDAIVNSTIWSDVLYCPQCGKELIFWELAHENGKIKDKLNCDCGANEFTKNSCERVFIEYYDTSLQMNIKLAKQIPVEINYTYKRKRYNKRPDSNDLQLFKKIDETIIPFWHPTNELPLGHNTKQPINSHGIRYSHLFFSKRNLYTLSYFKELIKELSFPKRYVFTSILTSIGRMYKYRIGGGGQPAGNNLYIPSLNREQNPLNPLKRKFNQILKSESEISNFSNKKTIVSTQSSTDLSNIPKNSIDYMFVDPPFGANIMYSELNYIAESWFKVFTNNKEEAIMNKTQHKQLAEYKDLMTQSFKEFFRILKPNRWITVEFHNSKASVWRTIQESIIHSGFIIAQVSILDKKQATFKQVTSPNAVENDLIINAYKPSEKFTKCFIQRSGLNLEDYFINMHLGKLPIEPNVERTQHRLHSKFIAQYIQNGFEIRVDASDFYDLLRENFEERDGYWFTHEQIPIYEKKSRLHNNLEQEDLNQTILGISDEKSAIVWLAQFLNEPKTYDEIFIEFSKNLLTSIDKIPELITILDENFSTERSKYRLPSDIERKEKEEVRDKRLMKEFNEIFDEAQSKRKIKEARKEAILYGLMKLYKEKDVEKIRFLGERLEQNIIDSDDDISAIIDWAMYN